MKTNNDSMLELSKILVDATAREILKSLNWDDIFGNTSQIENLYDFLKNKISVDEFVKGFYPRSKNRKIVKELRFEYVPEFKKHAKKLWNMSNVQTFSNGHENIDRHKYLAKI